MRGVFSDREFNKKFFALVLPIAFQQLMLAVVSASDAIMLNLISQEKMAAVSLATQITFVQNLFLASMTIGLSAIAAQYFGKGDISACERIFAYVLKLTVAVSVVFFLGGLCLPRALMRLFTEEEGLIADGASYLRIVSPSYLLTGISQIYLCALKNSGRAKKSSVVASVCMAGDMLMNALLIVGLFGFPRMGVAGAALSTTIARAIEAAWCVIASKSDAVKLRIVHLLRTDKTLARAFWRCTLPVLGNELVWGIGFASYSAIMGRLGGDAVAASSIANIVKNLAVCLCLGVGNGGGILVGNLLGRGEREKAKEYGGRLCQMALLFGTLSGLALLAISPIVLRFADLTPRANGYLRGMLYICAYYLVGKSLNCTTIAGIFCAGGDSSFGFLCDAVVMWGICVPLGVLSAFAWNAPVLVVYFLVSLDEFCKLPAVYIHYKKYKWVNDLTNKEKSL